MDKLYLEASREDGESDGKGQSPPFAFRRKEDAPDPAEATLALGVELALKEAPTIAKVPFPVDLVRVACDCGAGLLYYNEHRDCWVYPQYLHRGEEEEVDKILREDHRLLRCRSCYRLVRV